MAQPSKIEWTDSTWNPVTGCTKISHGCKHCYAERMAKRIQLAGVEKYKHGFQVAVHESALEEPTRWKKPRMIFVNSMSDLFHSKVPTDFILSVFHTMNRSPQHIFQVLTKRPGRVRKINGKLPWAQNIWMGTSIESERWKTRLDELKSTDAQVKFLSLEPLLGPLPNLDLDGIDWVIVGGESGPKARPMRIEWVREIRDMCVENKTPFFFKQWGAFSRSAPGGLWTVKFGTNSLLLCGSGPAVGKRRDIQNHPPHPGLPVRGAAGVLALRSRGRRPAGYLKSTPQDARFSKNIFIVAPGLTVNSRLDVLQPSGGSNYYTEFNIVPGDLMEKLRQGKVRICNWHALGWESAQQIQKKKGVDKRGAKSDEAYTREALGELASARNLLVINDEAHHAWRVNPQAPGQRMRRDLKQRAAEATVWVNGLDRIHGTRGILACYDFSATPFVPSGGPDSEEQLFGWIVSDFGLSDAIESGLVKTPRVVVRDDALPDAKSYKSRLYHIYNDGDVKSDLSRAAKPEERLPDLVLNAYALLGFDWRETAKAWKKQGAPTPPVMISVCNRTETAARVKRALDKGHIRIAELCEPEGVLHIDSKVLAKADAQDEVETVDGVDAGDDGGNAKGARKLTEAQWAERLRAQVDTVGKPGKPGARIQKVISVDMLSEGWDAKTVTHILGLRAFSSQLLCEQVVGRGLRRTAYQLDPATGLFPAEYVNVFGVPFSFLPHEDPGGDPLPVTAKTAIEPAADKAAFEIRWPNVLRIEHAYRPRLSLDESKVEALQLDAADTPQIAQLAPVVDGKADVSKVREIDLEKLAKDLRMQTLIFESAADVYAQMKENWRGGREFLLAQVVATVERFIAAGLVHITPPLFNNNPLRRRIMLMLNMSKIVNHLWQAIRFANTEHPTLVFDKDRPLRSTADMRAWHTGKPCEYTKRSHINFCVLDSAWEATEAFELDRHPEVDAWVKNDHLGFDILYTHNGVVKKYWPDFIIRMQSGDHLVLEVKGQDKDIDKTKRRFLKEWAKAVTEDGRFGKWHCAVSRHPTEIRGVLDALSGAARAK